MKAGPLGRSTVLLHHRRIVSRIISSSSTMRANLILVFVIGLTSAAISDKSPNKDWDDEDSMILPSTTSKGFSPFSRVPVEEKPVPVVLDDRTRYISLIPGSEQRENSQELNTENAVTKSEGLYIPARDPLPQPNEDIKSDEPAATQEDSGEESDSSASSEYTTEGAKIRIVQLGKIPLTYEIIPLMTNDDQAYDKPHVKPISFFPEQSGDAMINKARILRREQQQQQRREIQDEPAVEDVHQVQRKEGDDDELPRVPLTYLTPPREDADTYWRQYPLPIEQTSEQVINVGEANHEASASEADVQEPNTTLNPILERLNAFLQKAKRHSDELQFQKVNNIPEEEPKEESTGETREISQTTQEEDDTTNIAPSSASTENSEDLSTRTLSISTPLPTLATELTPPKLGVPESEPYSQSGFQAASPYWSNAPVSPSVDQYFSDYIQNSIPINKYYYSNPAPLQIQTSMKPPMRSLYPSMDSYLPRSYSPFEKAVSSSNNIDYPFIRYNDYYRPSRSNLIARPTPPVMNRIDDEDSYLGAIRYNELGGYAYGNPSLNRLNLGSSPYYDSYYPRSYRADSYRSRPIVPYQPQPQPYYSSSNLVNSLMYAPSYSYQQYRQLQPQQEYI